jgi:heme-degrading monooxygenase HmoA
MSYLIVWTYDVAPPQQAAFRAAYGPDGVWARMFAQAPGFAGVELYQDGARFLTLDKWESRSAFDAFQAAHGGEYAALDVKLAHLSVGQVCVGAFEGA